MSREKRSWNPNRGHCRHSHKILFLGSTWPIFLLGKVTNWKNIIIMFQISTIKKHWFRVPTVSVHFSQHLWQSTSKDVKTKTPKACLHLSMKSQSKLRSPGHWYVTSVVGNSVSPVSKFIKVNVLVNTWTNSRRKIFSIGRHCLKYHRTTKTWSSRKTGPQNELNSSITIWENFTKGQS